MKKIMIVSIILAFVTSIASYSNYYGFNSNYQNYSYGGWQYPSYYSGCTAQPVKKAPPRTMRTRVSQTLEAQYDNLVVMFTKNQCPYCDYLAPIMNQAAAKFKKNIKFLMVDIDQYPQYPAQYGFNTVPQVIYFKNGQRLDIHGSDNYNMTLKRVQQKIINYFGGQ